MERPFFVPKITSSSSEQTPAPTNLFPFSIFIANIPLFLIFENNPKEVLLTIPVWVAIKINLSGSKLFTDKTVVIFSCPVICKTLTKALPFEVLDPKGTS